MSRGVSRPDHFSLRSERFCGVAKIYSAKNGASKRREDGRGRKETLPTSIFYILTFVLFFAQTQIGLSAINLKERVERYIYSPLELLTGFSATAGRNFLSKTCKTVKCTGQQKSEKLPSLLTKTENQTQNSRKPANRVRS